MSDQAEGTRDQGPELQFLVPGPFALPSVFPCPPAGYIPRLRPTGGTLRLPTPATSPRGGARHMLRKTLLYLSNQQRVFRFVRGNRLLGWVGGLEHYPNHI